MKQDNRKYPWLALSLSILLPGLGQVYAGAVLRGVAFMAGVLALYTGAYHYLMSPDFGLGLFWLYFLFAGVINIGGWVDAFLCARRHNRIEGLGRLPGKNPWLAVLLSIIIPGLGHFYCARYVAGIVLLLAWLLLNIPAYFFPWCFPLLPVYTALISVHAHFSTPDSDAHRRGIKLFVVTALVMLTLQTSFSALLGPQVFEVFRTKAQNPFIPMW